MDDGCIAFPGPGLLRSVADDRLVVIRESVFLHLGVRGSAGSIYLVQCALLGPDHVPDERPQTAGHYHGVPNDC